MMMVKANKKIGKRKDVGLLKRIWVKLNFFTKKITLFNVVKKTSNSVSGIYLARSQLGETQVFLTLPKIHFSEISSNFTFAEFLPIFS